MLDSLIPAQLALIESLRECLQNLQDTTARLFRLTQSLPAGKVRDELLNEVSCLDSIADGIGQVLDACG